jgi:hypothetical protein
MIRITWQAGKPTSASLWHSQLFEPVSFPAEYIRITVFREVDHGRSTGFCQTCKRKEPLLERSDEIENKVLHNGDLLWICRIQ